MIENDDKKKLYPPGELKCIWMSAGVVSYKLCDRDYECDGCPYDISIKNRIASTSECTKDIMAGSYNNKTTPDKKERIQLLIDRLLTINIDTKYYYSKNHMWIYPCADGLIKIGLDDTATKILQYITGIVMMPEEYTIKRYQTFCWLIQTRFILSVYSPITGTIKEQNHDLILSPEILRINYKENSWLMKIHPKNFSQEVKSFLKGSEAKNWHQNELARIKNMFLKKIENKIPIPGYTLFDGGMTANSLQEAVSSEDFISILNSILKLESFKID